MYFGLIVPAYGYAYFSPGIIEGYGYSPIQTQLHSVPPWAAAFGYCMLVATISDRVRHRFGFAVFSICVAISGFAILTTIHDNTTVQYAALFLVTMGTYTAMPIIVCWFNMNLGGHHRRSVGSAWQVSIILRPPRSRNMLTLLQDRLWQYRWHYCSLCLYNYGGTGICYRILDLPFVYMSEHPLVYYLWCWMLASEQKA